jgi:hypothetical protein
MSASQLIWQNEARFMKRACIAEGRSERPHPSVALAATKGSPMSSRDVCLPLVDDDLSEIQVMGRMLADYPEQRFATSGEAALRIAREMTPDLIVRVLDREHRPQCRDGQRPLQDGRMPRGTLPARMAAASAHYRSTIVSNPP